MIRIRHNEIWLTRGDTALTKLMFCDCCGKEIEPDFQGVFTVKQNYDDAQPLLEKELYRMYLGFEHDDTQSLEPGDYYYDIQLHLGQQVQTVGPYKFHLLSDITND